ncbi:DUF883 family protein [Massilia yuzhufengensis]|uniref:Membrane-anchored ribosome-binding protein, inhibits growth in stationary phase, ElaB/YqjD/DUF883 family n=1 Tax=Massilia yuzhufengensis TaxID=1164594 RepID=A0A1I1F193_9BURK|nr:DUF883 family protein [Massilia yuzhufengensis]SFB93074.1 Membrane-anchored ribosome-binding protein, inhibits growth in stationary phase, ElaB/YqjD/DUF883 family [Massilia yuzhufengensis]
MLDTTRSNVKAQAHAQQFDSNLADAQSDVKSLVRDAQSMLTAAGALTGEKADELRNRGMEMLDRALGRAGRYQGQALEKGKELAHDADVYVKDNPWRTVAVAAGVGVLLGVLLSRKQ